MLLCWHFKSDRRRRRERGVCGGGMQVRPYGVKMMVEILREEEMFAQSSRDTRETYRWIHACGMDDLRIHRTRVGIDDVDGCVHVFS